MRICLVGASHAVDDDRMFYRAAVTLSRKYKVEVIGAGESNAVFVKSSILVTSFRKRSKIGHILLIIAILIRIKSTKFDILHCFDLESLATAVLVSRIFAPRPIIIYDAHEDFPSIMAGLFPLPKTLAAAVQFFLDIFERFFASYCDGFITDRDTLTERFNVYGKTTDKIRNLASLSWFDDAKQTNLLEDVSDPIVVFFGNLGERKGLGTAISAYALLVSQGVKVCLVLAGNLHDLPTGYPPSLKITGWLDYVEALPGLLKKASIGLALSKPVIRSYRTAPPAKVFHCMVAGLPVIASDNPGTGVGTIVETENCGILVDPSSVEQVAQAIRKLLNDEDARSRMGKNARCAAEREYNWEMESQKLMKFYRKILTTASKDN